MIHRSTLREVRSRLARRPERGRLVGALLVVGLVAACGGEPAPAPRASARGEDAAPAPAPRVELLEMDADVWAFSRRVYGVADPGCAEVEVEVEGQGGAWRARILAARRGARVEARVPLRSGANRVRAVCVGAEGARWRSAPVTLRVPMADRPEARARVLLLDDGLTLDAGASRVAEGRGAPITGARWRAAGLGNPAPLETVDGRALADGVSGERLTLRAPVVDGFYQVALEVEDSDGARDGARAAFEVVHGEALAVDPLRRPARWLEGAVLYGVVPFLFGADGLESVRARLDRLARLGVDALWLAPITDAPDDDYGYAVRDHFAVRAAYGDADDLDRLVADAHARGMRVIMDLVPNHTSDAHPYFVHARLHGPRSPYHAYYARDEQGGATHYFDWTHLPNLDLDHPEVRRWLIEAAVHWVREHDIDGYRVDVAWGLAARAPELAREMIAALRRVKPDVVFIAEASARDPFWVERGADAAYDWTWELGAWAWADAFGGEGVDLARLRAALTVDGEGLPAGALPVRFLNNNDTGERFITRHGPGVQRAALALLFGVPGVLALFTGDGLGAEYEPYQRLAPLDWEAGDAWQPWIARLAAARRAEAALARGALTVLDATPPEQALALLRWLPDLRAPLSAPARPVLVVLSFSEAPVTVTLALPPAVADAFAGSAARDLLDDAPVALTQQGAGRLSLELAPFAARYLTPR